VPYAAREQGINVPTAPTLVQALRYKEPVDVILYNGGTTSVWARTDGALATTAWPSREVPAGGRGVFILTPENGDAVLSLIAATSSVNCTLQVLSFRSPLIAEIVGAAALLALFILDSFFRLTGGDTLVPTGAITTIQARSGASLILENDQANVGVSLGAGANGSALVAADGTGFAEIRSSDAADFFRATTGGTMGVFRNSARSLIFADAETGVSNLTSRPLVLRAGETTDERHRLSSSAQTYRMVGDADADDVIEIRERAIVDGEVVAGGQLVAIAIGSGRLRVPQAGDLPAGPCVAGGTGNAAGTVKATYVTDGIATLLVADDAGVTQGQYIIAGATDAFEVASQAAIENSCAKVLDTAASAAPVLARHLGVT